MKTDQEIADELVTEIEACWQNGGRYEAAPVQNAPLPMVNIFDGRGRMPVATVTITYGQAVWGPDWEHRASGTAAKMADAIIATLPETGA